jgi:hypothetical protein
MGGEVYFSLRVSSGLRPTFSVLFGCTVIGRLAAYGARPALNVAPKRPVPLAKLTNRSGRRREPTRAL